MVNIRTYTFINLFFLNVACYRNQCLTCFTCASALAAAIFFQKSISNIKFIRIFVEQELSGGGINDESREAAQK